MKRVNILFGLIGLAIGLYVFMETRTFPTDNIMKIGPGFFPRILASGLMIFSAVLMVQNILGKGEDGEAGFDIRDEGVRRAGLVLLITIAYVIIMSLFGFVPSTILYLMVLMYMMKLRKWVLMGTVSLGVSLTVYLVFSVLLNIALPRGFWA